MPFANMKPEISEFFVLAVAVCQQLDALQSAELPELYESLAILMQKITQSTNKLEVVNDLTCALSEFKVTHTRLVNEFVDTICTRMISTLLADSSYMRVFDVLALRHVCCAPNNCVIDNSRRCVSCGIFTG